MTQLKNKVVWITGASSGIGEALAYEFAKKGAKLILSARRKTVLEQVKGNCSPESQANVHILPIDLSVPSTLALCTQAAIQLFGRVDILVNNAGIRQRSLALETTLEADRQMMEVNYFGAIALTKLILPHFLKNNSGHLVTISSLVGKFGTPYRSGYAASKHALHGFFDSLRAELWSTTKRAIKVTLICPGFINTSLALPSSQEASSTQSLPDTSYSRKPVEWCARKIIMVIEKDKEEVYLGGREVFGVYVKRFFPSIFSRVIRRVKVY